MATIDLLGHRRERTQQPEPAPSAGETTEPTLTHTNDTYPDVRIMEKGEPQPYPAKWGEGVLQSFLVRVTRVYEDDKRHPRTTLYPVTTAVRTDSDKRALEVVSHSDALLTRPLVSGTATNHYFWNPARAGFPTVNVGPKRSPHPIRKFIPHTIALGEMADDVLQVTRKVAEDEELGIAPDADGWMEMGAAGYSKGLQMAIMKAARARIWKIRMNRLYGRGPGPRNEVSYRQLAARVLTKGPHDIINAGKQFVKEPRKAVTNYTGVLAKDPMDLIGHLGDAFALRTGATGEAMFHIDRTISGRIVTFENDMFGLHSEYGVDFQDGEEAAAALRPFANLDYRVKPGSHMTGMDSDYVELDRDDWQIAANEQLRRRSQQNSTLEAQ